MMVLCLLGKGTKGGLSPTNQVEDSFYCSFPLVPEDDVDVLIEMEQVDLTWWWFIWEGIQPGQGGWGCFRMTLKKNVQSMSWN